MSSAEQPDYVTVQEYLLQEQSSIIKHEYVDGWVRAMTGATNRHNRIGINCTFQLMKQLQGKPCQPCNSDTKVRIQQRGSTRFYYPDLQVVCDPNSESEVYQDHPKLIIEILSASTRRIDHDEKLVAYTQITSLDYYIIFEQHQPQAILMRRIEGRFTRELIEGLSAIIELPSLCCSLALKDVYDGVTFSSVNVKEAEMLYENGFKD
ncbi:MAG: Uma2 family endonuclease [Pirellula sp.]